MKTIILILIILMAACAGHGNNNARLPKVNYPFPVKQFEIATQKQNLNMSYMDVGAKDSKKTIVLLHGKNFSGAYWKETASFLKNKNYRVIIPDQIGFGKSSKPEYYQYSFAQLSLNTIKLLDSLKIHDFSIMGHSMGGMLAVNMAYLYPKRVTKLILLNPIGLENYKKLVEFKDPEFFYENEKRKTTKDLQAYMQKNYFDGKWKAEYDNLLELHQHWTRGEDYPLVAWNSALLYGPIFSEEIVSLMSKIDVHTTLIIGARDKTAPGRAWKKPRYKNYKMGVYEKLGKDASQKLKNSKLYEMRGVGHLPQIEARTRYFKILDQVF